MSLLNPIRRHPAVVVSLCLLSLQAMAVDVPNRNPPVEERALREARPAIAASRWVEAVEKLRAHVKSDSDDADAYNLLGYSLRRSGQHADAQLAYERALQIDPSHRGAHEYLGELMLTLGRRDRAAFHLGQLEQLCQAKCEEYLQLKKSVDGQAPSPPSRPW